MTDYCPGCLDVWCIEPAKFERRDWVNVRTGLSLHVTCGRSLEAIRTVPPVAEQEMAA